MTGMTGYLFWGFLIVYGFIMFLLSPKKVTEAGFLEEIVIKVNDQLK